MEYSSLKQCISPLAILFPAYILYSQKESGNLFHRTKHNCVDTCSCEWVGGTAMSTPAEEWSNSELNPGSLSSSPCSLTTSLCF